MLDKITKGQALLSPEMLGLGASLIKGSTPPAWLRAWDGPEDAMGWIRGCLHRSLSLVSWEEKALAGSLLRAEVDLSEVFNPAVFMNALRVLTARTLNTPVDSLKMSASWEGGAASGPTATVAGIQIQGAVFSGKLAETQPNSAPSSPIPTVTLSWVPEGSPDPYSTSASIPLYTTDEREKLVAELKMPCGPDVQKWAQAGAALFLK